MSAKEIDRVLEGLFKPEKRFMGHLTIGRVKGVKSKKEFIEKLEKIKVSEMKFRVNSFNLMESKLSETGAKYRVLKKYNLESN